MNLSRPDKIVVLGFLSHFPVAGVAWQTVHYLLGFQRLGYEVYYVESHGCTPSKLMRNETDDGHARAAEYIEEIMQRFGLERQWAYHAPYPESRYFGMSETQLRTLYGSAALLINLHGSHLPSAELAATHRLVYLGTDPVDIEIEVHNKNTEAIEYLASHCAFFTFGENLGQPDCRVPLPEPFAFKPTRQPVILDLWEPHGHADSDVFTTIGNWRQPWREVKFERETYRWSKHFEFQKFLDVPRRVRPQAFELALSSYDAKDKQLLEEHGWRVRHALDLSKDLDAYRSYIAGSRGEFTVAKDQNIRLRSGWFSDRATTYLAAGRPVITQDTGFNDFLPTGEGLFSFSTMEEIVAAVQAINADYERHRRAALAVARECFSHEVVLRRMLDDLGLSSHVPSRSGMGISSVSFNGSQQSKAHGRDIRPTTFPRDLVVRPISRWPTRLPEDTIRFALSLAPPESTSPPVEPAQHLLANLAPNRRTSVIIVTHQGLPFTKLCLTSLFANGWKAGDELIIVDNASSDGTPEYLRKLARVNACVRIVLNERNAGFGAANNQALSLATGDVLIVLNGDTLLPPCWRDGLLRWLGNGDVGLVGPVTNRTCNEAQIDTAYKTYDEFARFARARAEKHLGIVSEIPMLALFCAAMRRDVFAKVGPLDEQFEVGMFEDDDYSLRIRDAGYRILCAEDVFVHHFGQGSLGELCVTGDYDRVFKANRLRFEAKWQQKWKPHGRRVEPDYQLLRERIRRTASTHLPRGATVMVVSKGDDELLRLGELAGWHFPQADGGSYANVYPADGTAAVAHLEMLRTKGARYLLIPKPALWWLEYYTAFREHLESRCRSVLRDPDTCLIFDLGGADA